MTNREPRRDVSIGIFFQAEDGIRYYKVTGVQTCALPISGCAPAAHPSRPETNVAKNQLDRKSTRLNSSHLVISYAVFCLKKNKTQKHNLRSARTGFVREHRTPHHSLS